MGTTRFALGSANQTCASYATLINGASTGTYPSRPALSQDAQYPMSNLRINDRLALWRSDPALTGQYDVEWDLGGDRTLELIAVHGWRLAAGQTAPPSVDVSYRTSASGYSQAGTWIALVNALPLSVRDPGRQLAAPVRGRYVRFRFNAGGSGGGFVVANFFLGVVTYDLGIISSPDMIDRIEFACVRDGRPGMVSIITQIGDDGRVFVLPFNNVKDERKAQLDAVARSALWTTMITHQDEILQVRRADDTYERTLRFSPPNRWSMNLALEMGV